MPFHIPLGNYINVVVLQLAGSNVSIKMTFLKLKLKFIFIGNILPCYKEDLAFHFATFCKEHTEWDKVVEVEDINIGFHRYLQVTGGSIFTTGSKVLRDRETSLLWFGVSGV